MRHFILILLISLLVLPVEGAWSAPTRVKTWVDGQVLSAADLNAEFDNLITGFGSYMPNTKAAIEALLTGAITTHTHAYLANTKSAVEAVLTGVISSHSHSGSSLPSWIQQTLMTLTGVNSFGTSYDICVSSVNYPGSYHDSLGRAGGLVYSKDSNNSNLADTKFGSPVYGEGFRWDSGEACLMINNEYAPVANLSVAGSLGFMIGDTGEVFSGGSGWHNNIYLHADVDKANKIAYLCGVKHTPSTFDTDSLDFQLFSYAEVTDKGMHWDSDEYEVGINDGTPSATLDIHGNLAVQHPGAFSGTNVVWAASTEIGLDTSSRRFKKLIEPLKADWNKIMSLKPVYFLRNGEPDGDAKHPGFLAEDMAEVYPGAVQYDKEGAPFSISDGKITAPLAAGIQDLKRENDDLKEKMKALVKRVEELERKCR